MNRKYMPLKYYPFYSSYYQIIEIVNIDFMIFTDFITILITLLMHACQVLFDM